MECRIEGDTLPFLIVRLEQGDEIVAEVGSMAYMTEGVKWSITLWGRGLIAKLWGMVRRRLTGETVLLTRFQGNGEVAFTGKFPGTIQRIDLDTARTVIAQRGSFLAATRDVRMKMAVARRLRATLFGGEKLLLQKFQGPGTAWLHAAGDFKRFDLKAGQKLRADTECLVYYDDTVDYSVGMVGGIRRMLFGGEGLFLATFTGPGEVGLQSMPVKALRQSLEKK